MPAYMSADFGKILFNKYFHLENKNTLKKVFQIQKFKEKKNKKLGTPWP